MSFESTLNDLKAKASAAVDKFTKLEYWKRWAILGGLGFLFAMVVFTCTQPAQAAAEGTQLSTMIGKSRVHGAMFDGQRSWIVLMQDADGCGAGKRAIGLGADGKVALQLDGCWQDAGAEVHLIFANGNSVALPAAAFAYAKPSI